MIRNCTGSGVKLATTAGSVRSTLVGVRVHGCSVAISAANRTSIHIQDSVFTLDSIGIQTTGTNNSVSADNVAMTLGTTGIIANPGSFIRLSDSTITGYSTGINPNGGSIISMQGNNLTGNGANGTFTSTAGKL